MLSNTKLLKLDGIEVEVTYQAFPKEKRNKGHPDNRLPDEPMHMVILSMEVQDWDDKKIIQFIKDSNNA